MLMLAFIWFVSGLLFIVGWLICYDLTLRGVVYCWSDWVFMYVAVFCFKLLCELLFACFDMVDCMVSVCCFADFCVIVNGVVV